MKHALDHSPSCLLKHQLHEPLCDSSQTLPNSLASPSSWTVSLRISTDRSRSLLRMAPHPSAYPSPQLQLSPHLPPPLCAIFLQGTQQHPTSSLSSLTHRVHFPLTPAELNFVKDFLFENIHKQASKRTNTPPHSQVGTLRSCLFNEPLTFLQSILLAIHLASMGCSTSSNLVLMLPFMTFPPPRYTKLLLHSY